jgi:plasmid stabilization system protein ParE
MRIRWTRAAAGDLEQIGRYLKEHQPTFAESTVQKLYQAARISRDNRLDRTCVPLARLCPR